MKKIQPLNIRLICTTVILYLTTHNWNKMYLPANINTRNYYSQYICRYISQDRDKGAEISRNLYPDVVFKPVGLSHSIVLFFFFPSLQ